VSAQSIIEVEDLTIGYASDGHDTVVLEGRVVPGAAGAKCS